MGYLKCLLHAKLSFRAHSLTIPFRSCGMIRFWQMAALLFTSPRTPETSWLLVSPQTLLTSPTSPSTKPTHSSLALLLSGLQTSDAVRLCPAPQASSSAVQRVVSIWRLRSLPLRPASASRSSRRRSCSTTSSLTRRTTSSFRPGAVSRALTTHRTLRLAGLHQRCHSFQALGRARQTFCTPSTMAAQSASRLPTWASETASARHGLPPQVLLRKLSSKTLVCLAARPST